MCGPRPPYYDDVTINLRGEATMRTATNIQTATNQATITEANSDIKEAGKMTNENNIHGINSLVSNALKTNRATSIIAGLLIGGMIAAASMLPGNASADTPARPVGDPESAAKITHTFDMDLLDPGFYDAKVIRTSNTANVMDMDLLDPGFYIAKLVSTSRVWESPGFDPYEDIDAKVIRTSNTANVTDMDLLDPGFYNAKLVSTTRVWESPGFDPYEDIEAKVVRTSSTAHAFDMDLLDPGIYDAKLVSNSPSLEGLQEDNII